MVEFNHLLIAFAGLYLLPLLLSLWLKRLNLANLGTRVPRGFEDFVDAKRLSEVNDYALARGRLGLRQRVASDVTLLGLILAGCLYYLDQLAASLGLQDLPAGLFLFAALGCITYTVELPFDYYRNFVIEEKYGFNRSNLQTWLLDQLKVAGLSMLFLLLLLSPILWAIHRFPNRWWLMGFAVVFLIQLLVAVLYPILIAPLFNRFEPLEDQNLVKKIERLMEEVGLGVRGVFQMDAGRRTTHTNAYFTGLGKTKRVVLFDTLLQAHPHEEIIAILAHELGHFKKRHIIKQLLLLGPSMLAGFYLTSLILEWPLLYITFGFDQPRSAVGLFLLGICWQRAGYFLRPLYLGLSRHFEREADRFVSVLLETAEPLATALKRMAAHNLANLTPHPLYVRFNDSHPPLIERVASLEKSGPQRKSSRIVSV